jgi:hypothetical protein
MCEISRRLRKQRFRGKCFSPSYVFVGVIVHVIVTSLYRSNTFDFWVCTVRFVTVWAEVLCSVFTDDWKRGRSYFSWCSCHILGPSSLECVVNVGFVTLQWLLQTCSFQLADQCLYKLKKRKRKGTKNWKGTRKKSHFKHYKVWSKNSETWWVKITIYC